MGSQSCLRALEISHNYLGSGKISLKTRIVYFNLNKCPTKFYNVPTPTSAKTGGDNKF